MTILNNSLRIQLTQLLSKTQRITHFQIFLRPSLSIIRLEMPELAWKTSPKYVLKSRFKFKSISIDFLDSCFLSVKTDIRCINCIAWISHKYCKNYASKLRVKTTPCSFLWMLHTACDNYRFLEGCSNFLEFRKKITKYLRTNANIDCWLFYTRFWFDQNKMKTFLICWSIFIQKLQIRLKNQKRQISLQLITFNNLIAESEGHQVELVISRW